MNEQRAGRAIRLLAPALILGYALLSIVERRSLHADGSWAFVQSLLNEGYWVGDPYRLVADTIAETPISVAMQLGVTDRGALAFAHGLGYILIPSLAWVAALWITRAGLVFDFILLAYCATALTSGFLAIGEYNFLFAFTALCFAAIVQFWTRQRRGMAWTAAGAAVIVLSSHGLAILLAPLLLVATLLPMRRFGRPATGGPAILLTASLLLAASMTGVMAVVLPYTSGNVKRASDLGTPLTENRQLLIVFAWFVLLPVAILARRRVVRALVGVILTLGLLLLVFDRELWASPWQQHASRSWSAILLFVLLAEALVAAWPDLGSAGSTSLEPDAGPANRLRLWSFGLFVALLVPATVQTVQFGSFVRDFETYVNERSGFVANGDFLRDVPAAERYGWPATFPSLSVALGRTTRSAIVLNPRVTVWDPPFPDREPPVLPERFRD
jgi:hypothetical protein